MSNTFGEWTAFAQPTDFELQTRAKETKEKARKKGTELHPITVSGRNITSSWWGNAWCSNLERYADFESRIARGKRYVRAGMVVDLQIKPGKVTARVQGSRKTPYKIEINIQPLDENKCRKIVDSCTRKAANIDTLLAGAFPEDMQELFSGKDGLFPSPKEIRFSCSCPDWAVMCKHVAAVLYGIGVRFDEDPLLFFMLRGIDVNKFIDASIATRVDKLLSKAEAGGRSRRVMDADCDLTSVFGVL